MSSKDTEPEAYTLGWVPFINTKIYLDSRPLIPRTETEYWVDIAIKEIRAKNIKEPRILDLCAGSGCIGIAVLKELPEAFVDFAEIEETHHKTIEKNIKENDLDASRTRIFGGDLFENITEQYDFILSNPPYLNPELSHRIEPSVINYEPAKALYGGKEGLEIIREILSIFSKNLKKGGVFYIEHEPEQVFFLSREPGYTNSEKDQYGVERFSRFHES